MTDNNMYGTNLPDYYWNKPHYNLANKFFYSDFYKLINPIRINTIDTPHSEAQLPLYMGTVPNQTWLYGNLDYSFSKYHRHY